MLHHLKLKVILVLKGSMIIYHDWHQISLGLCMMCMYENYTNTNTAGESYKGEWGSCNKFVLNNAKNKI